jgi:hypothetical protein
VEGNAGIGLRGRRLRCFVVAVVARVCNGCTSNKRRCSIPGRAKSRACRWIQRFNHTAAHRLLHSPAVTTAPRTPTRPPLHRSARARTPASTAALLACASCRAPPTPSAAVDPRGRDAKRSSQRFHPPPPAHCHAPGHSPARHITGEGSIHVGAHCQTPTTGLDWTILTGFSAL